MNEIEKKAKERAKQLWDAICLNHEHDGWGGSLARCHDCLTAALLDAYEEGLDEAKKAACIGCRYNLPIIKLRPCYHLAKNGDSLECTAQAIRELKGE